MVASALRTAGTPPAVRAGRAGSGARASAGRAPVAHTAHQAMGGAIRTPRAAVTAGFAPWQACQALCRLSSRRRIPSQMIDWLEGGGGVRLRSARPEEAPALSEREVASKGVGVRRGLPVAVPRRAVRHSRRHRVAGGGGGGRGLRSASAGIFHVGPKTPDARVDKRFVAPGHLQRRAGYGSGRPPCTTPPLVGHKPPRERRTRMPCRSLPAWAP